MELTFRQYYKPWDLRTEEEDRIKQQIEDTDSAIDKELAEHEQRKQAETGPPEVPQHSPKPAPSLAEDPKPDDPDTKMEEDEEQPKPELVGAPATNEQDTAPGPPTSNDNDVPRTVDVPTVRREEKLEERASDDHGGEELVEGQEDDVIY